MESAHRPLLMAALARRHRYSTAQWGAKTLMACRRAGRSARLQVDTVLVLERTAEHQKSTAIATLFESNTQPGSVNLFDQHNKMVAVDDGAWCVELAEFIAIAKARSRTRSRGCYRCAPTALSCPTPRDGQRPSPPVHFRHDQPRRERLSGTDVTGNRRYWPVEVSKAKIPSSRSNRDQMWPKPMRRSWPMNSGG